MRIRVARVSGFCFGVKRVIDLVEKISKREEVDTLGPIIHNPVVVAELENRGIRAVEKVEDTNKKALIIRAHGVPPDVYERAKERGIKLYDGTCPFVKNVQEMAKSLHEEGYEVVVVGKKNHPEVIGVVGHTNGSAVVVTTSEEARTVPLKKKRVGVVVQTTFRFDELIEILRELLKRTYELRIYNTRCADTDRRQQAAIELASQVDVMIVVGGKNSSNTRRLFELSQKVGAKAYHIETPDELKREWFKGVQDVGVIGGASTPQWLVESVVEKIKSFDESS